MKGTLGGGRMMVVGASAEELQPMLGPSLEISVVNSHVSCVVSGEAGAVAALEQRLGEAGRFTFLMPAPYAFHSWQMEPCLADIQASLADIEPDAAKIPWISSSAANLQGECADAAYWRAMPAEWCASIVLSSDCSRTAHACSSNWGRTRFWRSRSSNWRCAPESGAGVQRPAARGRWIHGAGGYPRRPLRKRCGAGLEGIPGDAGFVELPTYPGNARPTGSRRRRACRRARKPCMPGCRCSTLRDDSVPRPRMSPCARSTSLRQRLPMFRRRRLGRARRSPWRRRGKWSARRCRRYSGCHATSWMPKGFFRTRPDLDLADRVQAQAGGTGGIGTACHGRLRLSESGGAGAAPRAVGAAKEIQPTTCAPAARGRIPDTRWQCWGWLAGCRVRTVPRRSGKYCSSRRHASCRCRRRA